MLCRGMNIHHLELFYHVARHGGISRALPHMPYGIQQPAVSAQLIRLEKDLEVSLFRRRPFKLTGEGEKLFEFACPFFDRLDELENSLRHGSRHLRIAAAETVIRNHLPAPMMRLKREFPDLHLSLRGVDDRSLGQLAHGELDLVIGPAEQSAPAGILMETLIETRLLLLAPESAEGGTVAAFLKHHVGRTPLITLPGDSLVSRLFKDELARRGLAWGPSIELGGLDLIQRYVEAGFGVGLTVEGTLDAGPAGLKVLPLARFPRLRIAAYHAKKTDAVIHRLFAMIRLGARRIRTGGGVG